MNDHDRRTFLTGFGAAALAAALPRPAAGDDHAPTDRTGDRHRGPCVISSQNGLPAVELAARMVRDGADPLAAVVAGVSLVEDDPEDSSVGLGGLPNEDGVVQLDASVMHGPSHKAGAVGALEGIRNAAKVALLVLERTDHVMLVGEGAKRFALQHGFPEENLLTDASRRAWLKWKAQLNPTDDWLDSDQQIGTVSDELPAPTTDGTIHCAAVGRTGDVSACTTTSGLSYKLPGRVGDSPIIGAGMYVDNDVGTGGATGRGEAVIQSCGAFAIVQAMARGLSPSEACLDVLRQIARRTKRRDLLDEHGRPNFQVMVYALRKDGAYGAAAMHPGETFTVHDGEAARKLEAMALFP